MFRLGLTGGIATGKSTVSKYLKEKKGLPVLDADDIAHQIMGPNQPILTEIADVFGDDYIHDDGSLNRQKLGALVFNDDQARQKLDDLTHPRIFSAFEAQMLELESAGTALVVLDIPLLFENEQRLTYDAVAVVVTTEHTQLKRLMQRNALTESEAMARIQSQMPLDEKKASADYVIQNNGTPAETYKQVDQMIDQINQTIAERS
ncbi:dephospho-CoA kinase [Weissella viridescens]|uniref:dephospho-CoA kinase n=1 Tax=Weissella viridescens TaxID=1629 RepID=UPI001D08F7CF|nr:dephospho-CoA kinase [Weissella viridescens]MCB6839560.1 dephospho-CoA kinase [Weissella viridescens]MCB6846291.1 dephospho-CoA kinase [Weissella viridescens]